MIFGLIESTPLPTFLLYGAWINQRITQHWQSPFVTSSLLATYIKTMVGFDRNILYDLLMDTGERLEKGGKTFIEVYQTVGRYKRFQPSDICFGEGYITSSSSIMHDLY